MSTRYDAVAVRKWTDRDGNEQTAFTNIGVAFPFNDKDGFSLKLHCLPAPDEGEYTVLLFPPKPREDSDQRGGSSREQPQERQRYSADKTKRQAPAFQSGGLDDGDDIPF